MFSVRLESRCLQCQGWESRDTKWIPDLWALLFLKNKTWTELEREPLKLFSVLHIHGHTYTHLTFDCTMSIPVPILFISWHGRKSSLSWLVSLQCSQNTKERLQSYFHWHRLFGKVLIFFFNSKRIRTGFYQCIDQEYWEYLQLIIDNVLAEARPGSLTQLPSRPRSSTLSQSNTTCTPSKSCWIQCQIKDAGSSWLWQQ